MNVIELHPSGYPVHIDVPQHSIHGTGTAMRFELPVHGINFPLMHQHEEKLIVALSGRLTIRCAKRVIAHLDSDQAVLLPAGTAHRIAQSGDHPSIVGIALWPGAVEEAFRSVAAHVATNGFRREAVIDILGRYGITWEANSFNGDYCRSLVPAMARDLLDQLPRPLAAAIAVCWHASIYRRKNTSAVTDASLP